MTTETRKGIVAKPLSERLTQRWNEYAVKTPKGKRITFDSALFGWIIGAVEALESSSSSQDSLGAVRAKIAAFNEGEFAGAHSKDWHNGFGRGIRQALYEIDKIIAMKSEAGVKEG